MNGTKFYIYSNHLYGDLYYTTEKLTYDELYCEQCGDSDWLECIAEKPQDIWDALQDEIDIDGSGGYDKKYIEEFIQTIPWGADDESN